MPTPAFHCGLKYGRLDASSSSVAQVATAIRSKGGSYGERERATSSWAPAAQSEPRLLPVMPSWL